MYEKMKKNIAKNSRNSICGYFFGIPAIVGDIGWHGRGNNFWRDSLAMEGGGKQIGCLVLGRAIWKEKGGCCQTTSQRTCWCQFYGVGGTAPERQGKREREAWRGDTPRLVPALQLQGPPGVLRAVPQDDVPQLVDADDGADEGAAVRDLQPHPLIKVRPHPLPQWARCVIRRHRHRPLRGEAVGGTIRPSTQVSPTSRLEVLGLGNHNITNRNAAKRLHSNT